MNVLVVGIPFDRIAGLMTVPRLTVHIFGDPKYKPMCKCVNAL